MSVDPDIIGVTLAHLRRLERIERAAGQIAKLLPRSKNDRHAPFVPSELMCAVESLHDALEAK